MSIVGGGQPENTAQALDTPEQMRGHAVQLATRHALHVFPVDHPALPRCRGVKNREHNPDDCRDRGKHPTCKWSEWSTTDVELLVTGRYFGGKEPRNIGVDCGKSRLLVIDEDAPGELARFCRDHGIDMPATFTVRTGKGRHYYFRLPDGIDLGNTEGAFTGYKINIRGVGGYVVAAGSRHATGAQYAIEDAPRAVLPSPQWLVDAVTEKPATTGDTDADDAKPSKWWMHGAIGEGKRHGALMAAAGLARRRGLKKDEAVPIIRDVYRRLEGDKYTWEQALAKLSEVYDRYQSQLDLEIVKERRRRQARRAVDAEERPPAVIPEVVDLAHRLAHPLPPVEWRIDEWQPAGTRAVLAAQFKAGKTTMTGNLVRSLVDGAPFLDTYNVAPLDGTVAVLDFEMSQRQFLGWLADQNISNADQVLPISLRGNAAAFDIIDHEGRQRWKTLLRDRDVRYLVWDCLRPVVDALGLDEHNGVGPLLVAFDQLCVDAGIGDALVVHHMGHHSERSRGDSRIRDWPDIEWRLVRLDDQPASPRYVSAYGRDVDVAESRLEYDAATRRLRLVGGNRKSEAEQAALAAIIGFLDIDSKLSWTKVIEQAKDAGHAEKVSRSALRRAVDNGLVVVEDGPRRAKLHSLNPDHGSTADHGNNGLPRSVSEYGSTSYRDVLHSHDAAPAPPTLITSAPVPRSPSVEFDETGGPCAHCGVHCSARVDGQLAHVVCHRTKATA